MTNFLCGSLLRFRIFTAIKRSGCAPSFIQSSTHLIVDETREDKIHENPRSVTSTILKNAKGSSIFSLKISKNSFNLCARYLSIYCIFEDKRSARLLLQHTITIETVGKSFETFDFQIIIQCLSNNCTSYEDSWSTYSLLRRRLTAEVTSFDSSFLETLKMFVYHSIFK